ncbi:hypothetical protein CALCODRAFT_506607 [Calocera cornea HHB12733]|uniref:C2H2-type domain-containing protein n=1 Tax=Calocera cornea HHB12733 TaxID=1353952 RepID=A0A165ILB8_9BASI|nr:hypothetical protein CALCODRAFT_506607 [Calocera cornea HHB12733]
MSLPAYFTHGRSYAERDVDPSLVHPANPFRGEAFNAEDWVTSSAYADAASQLAFPQNPPFNGMTSQGQVPDLYVSDVYQQQMYGMPAATMHSAYATAPTLMDPMGALMPSSSMSSNQLAPPGYAYQHDNQCTVRLHHKRGLAPVMTPTPSPSSSISSMSDVSPATPAYGATPTAEHSYHLVFPVSYSPEMEQRDFSAEGSLDPEDLEDEAYQGDVSTWITQNAKTDYCGVCRKRFNRPCDLRRHVETIHVKRPGSFPCPRPGCTRVLCRKDVLQRHIKRQHEDKEAKPKRRS